MNNNDKNTRRLFIKKMLAGGAGVTTLSSMQLGFMNSAFAQTSCSNGGEDGYKALVCVSLFGGNDSYNMLIPMRGEELTDYQSIRKGLARTGGLEIFPNSGEISGGIGFVPEMEALKTLFDNGKLAIQGNVGNLIKPVIGADGYILDNAVYPSALGAHNLQQQTWQRGAELNQNNTASTGWSGRIMDNLFCVQNSDSFLRSISLIGQNTWQNGIEHKPYSINYSGVEKIDMFHGGNELGIRKPIAEDLMNNVQYTNVLDQAYANSLKTAENNARVLEADINTITDLTTEFSGENLSKQLEMVTKLIRIGKDKGLTRQVFIVGTGGFDTHANQVTSHPGLLAHVSNSLAEFYQSTVEMGIENEVTSFTISEFGRTLGPNADEGAGTDHGWAGHQLVLGGAVKGDVYGDILPQSQATLDRMNGGLAPTTASEEMHASLAQWFGVSRSDCDEIFPNLRNFVDVNQALNIDYFA